MNKEMIDLLNQLFLALQPIVGIVAGFGLGISLINFTLGTLKATMMLDSDVERSKRIARHAAVMASLELGSEDKPKKGNDEALSYDADFDYADAVDPDLGRPLSEILGVNLNAQETGNHE